MESMVGLHKLRYDIDVKKLIFLHKILSLDPDSIPTKTSWKTKVKRNVYSKAVLRRVAATGPTF